jgi:hypothetical protein
VKKRQMGAGLELATSQWLGVSCESGTRIFPWQHLAGTESCALCYRRREQMPIPGRYPECGFPAPIASLSLGSCEKSTSAKNPLIGSTIENSGMKLTLLILRDKIL